MSKVNDNSNQKVFNVFCRQVVRNVKEISLPEPFSNPSLNKETTAVLGVKPSRRIQRLRGIANRFNLKQPKCIQLS